MPHITANELKTRGVTAVEEKLRHEDEVIISVRGKDSYVLMTMEKYEKLRDCELDLALREARADYNAGRIERESVDDHIKRISPEPEGT
jgi:prevent-host-death family protein